VSGLPGHLKSGGGQGAKALLRESCSSVLSSEIANRPKTGFSLPIDDWMRGEMRDSCQAAIDRVAQVPFINAAEVHRIWGEFVADERSLHWSRPMALVVLGSSIG
jgi:asparagine synthase (glutamine-hydrolysing)